MHVVVRRLVIEYDYSNMRCLRGGAVYPWVACEANTGMDTYPVKVPQYYVLTICGDFSHMRRQEMWLLPFSHDSNRKDFIAILIINHETQLNMQGHLEN